MYRTKSPLQNHHLFVGAVKGGRSRAGDALEVIRLLSSIPGYRITPQVGHSAQTRADLIHLFRYGP